MRYIIMKLTSIIKKKLSIGFFKIKKRIKSWKDTYIEKGHEKMTVMFIPHNEKKIFNFHISKFTIAFFSILFLIVVLTSSYAIIKNANVKTEKEQLLSNYKDIRSHLVRFELLTNEVDGLISDIKPYIEDVYEITQGDNDVTKIWEHTNNDLIPNDDLITLKNILPEEVFTIREMQKELICTAKTVKTISRFIDVRRKVINDIPSIIPNRGHISSLFGWRRSPFGFGRDFHTGIDIAAPLGTLIRSTAPGTVVQAGWGGGYGYMVRIVHKYGYQTIYGHCQKIIVKKGEKIKKGKAIAYVGQTGSATGNHCHYEIRLGNVSINPYPYMSRIW